MDQMNIFSDESVKQPAVPKKRLLGDGCSNKKWYMYDECRFLVSDLLFSDGSRKMTIPHLNLTFKSEAYSLDALHRAIRAMKFFVCARKGEIYDPKKSFGTTTIAFHKETSAFEQLKPFPVF